jgi:MoxR-like ATPase
VASVARASVSIIARATHRPAHVLDRTSQLAINAALAAGRPLLVRGEPGVGKSQLALAAARAPRSPCSSPA